MRVYIANAQLKGAPATPREYVDIEKAVVRSLEKTHAEGSTERLQEEVGNVRKAVAVLAAALAESGHLSPNQLGELLNWPYTVEGTAGELEKELASGI